MTDTKPLGETLEAIMERVIFENPDSRVQRLREQWEEEKRLATEAFHRVCNDCYRTRLDFHRTCRELQSEVLARADASVLRQLCVEERDERLAGIWRDVTGRVSRVLGEIAAETEESR